ncbi:DnaJ domain-containing protein [Oscillospiraceae bacterium OttesenSCG-928-G22]|nr:DnaJ domain-containing protein [Oscillospiraceae bacterium OttesenSCG-928-G22]
MKQWTDYYSILQVHHDAELEVIQSAYKRLCRKYHPDINPTKEAEEKIRQINVAFEVLGNDTKRRQYHVEWQRRMRVFAGGRTATPPVSPAASHAPPRPARPTAEAAARRAATERTRQWTAPAEGTPAARDVIHQYFLGISKRALDNAYETLSEVDKKRISRSSFYEWQSSVGSLYEIGSFSIKLFKVRTDIQIEEGRTVKGEEYTIRLSEKTIATGQVTEYSLSKTAVFENGVWRVYLGYTDISALVNKFKHAPSTEEEARILSYWEDFKKTHNLEMGLLNRKGFEEASAPEIYRYKRYRRDFTVALFKMKLPTRVSEKEHRERILRFAGERIKNGLRMIDHLAYLGSGFFGVLFSETERGTAKLAARRLLFDVKREVSACFDVEVHVASGLVQYDGGEMEDVLCRAHMIVERMEKQAAEAVKSSV